MEVCGQAQRQGEVFQELSNLKKAQEHLNKAISCLADRLNPVLGQPKTSKPCDESKPETTIACSLSNEIQASTNTVENNIVVINSILDRLEI